MFESEFHQDTRPRQMFGASLLVLRDANSEAIAFCESYRRKFWNVRDAGCRVLHRDMKARIRNQPSKGQRAADAIYKLVRATGDFVEPNALWIVYPPGDIGNGYMTPKTRCAWSQPCFGAEDVAYLATQAVADAKAELQWQREELVRLILGWQRWSEDREAWAISVEKQWIPRVQEAGKGLHFDVRKYIERIRKELVPWEA